jgi:hypothetical protein
MPNVCACGCGEYLPEGSTREYKRGHKNRISEAASDGFAEAAIDEPFTPLTIDQAAELTPDDPEPKDAPEHKVKQVIKVTAGVRRDIEGKLAFALGLSGQMFVMVDPVCGSAFLDNADNVAKKLTPIMCQSPEVVRWFTRSGTFILWIDLMVALWPVLTVIFAHHIAKSVGATVAGANGQSAPEPNAYVVQ